MNIGIDITSLIYDRGVSRYTANLISALAKHSNLRLFLYGSTFRQKKNLLTKTKKITADSNAPIKIKIKQIPSKISSKFWGFGLNKISNIWPNLDLFHSWDWIQPPDKNLPLVSTIHDLAILKFPETAHPKILKMHQKSWKILKKRKAHVIAVSKATKKDIVELLQIPAKKIHVIYEALPRETTQIANNLSEEKFEKIKDRLNLDKPYLLFVGTREPRKNLERLIKAWEPLSETHNLIIAGEKGWDKTNLKNSATNTTPTPPKKTAPRFLGKVTDEELVVLYSQTDCFVYPSLYEGFGLPILEAFSFGAPVVTSNVSAMPEVAGNAAELVDPNSTAQIRKAIQKILAEDKTQQSRRLQKMIIRLQLFSWEKVARETIEVYNQAILQHQENKES